MHSLIAWFARNSVAANLLMCFIFFAGWAALKGGKIPVEFFPEWEERWVSVSMTYRGATPAEVEEQVIIRIEEAIYDLEGIEKMRSVASEGRARIEIEVLEGFDPRDTADDIKSRVDAISTFPVEAENLLVRTPQDNSTAVSVILSGDLTERELRGLAETIRDEMAVLPGISQVEISGVRGFEIAIEVSEKTLQAYDLTLDDIANAVDRGSVDLPAGAIKTSAGEILLRTKGQAYVAEDFERIVVRTRPDGSRITVGDIATVIDGFEEDPFIARFNGAPAATVNVFYSSDQNLLDIAKIAKDYVEGRVESLPPGANMTLWRDRSVTVENRLNTLLESAMFGGCLVFLLLTLFLRFQLALWVCIGIPIAFMGGVALMPYLGVTINIISLFAFILVLGIVVDDAIVTGENIYTHLRKGGGGEQAVIKGAQEVAIPVTFGVFTTIVAFIPILFMPGRRGEIFFGIPAIVIPVLLFSLVESKFILPAHLKHLKTGRDPTKLWFLARLQHNVAVGLERFIQKIYAPFLERCIRNRYLVVSVFGAIFLVLVGLAASNRLKFVSFPRVGSETATARLQMPIGTPFEITEPQLDHIRDEAAKLQKRYTDPATGESVIKYIVVTKGGRGLSRGESTGGSPHLGEVALRLVPRENRSIAVETDEIVKEWRRGIGIIPGAEELAFHAHIGRGGEAIEVEIKHTDFDVIGRAVAAVEERLATYEGVFDIRDDSENGKEEIQLKLKPAAEQLGLTMADLGNQTRHAFFGQEAQRVLRDRDDIRVMVRYPLEERRSIENLETMRIRTPTGDEVPLTDVAEITIGRSYSNIVRENRKRTISVYADMDKDRANVLAIQEDIYAFMEQLATDYPGLIYEFDGEIEEGREAGASLKTGIWFTVLAIFTLLAIPFGSYLQPFIIMSVIPFGLIGAVLGHLGMGLTLSFMSLFGMLALSGVIVNDSLVLVDYINRRRREGIELEEAVRRAGSARFRAIILTSLTTFFGLVPLIFERSTQAQFLIPMAVSLGFGILFATFVTLLLVPINYLILEDIKRPLAKYWKWQTTGWGNAPPTEVAKTAEEQT